MVFFFFNESDCVYKILIIYDLSYNRMAIISTRMLFYTMHYITYEHYMIKCDFMQAQDVNFAMEASRKSRIAFAAANVSLGETKNGESISSIKRALDFNFHDVEGLLRLVKLAMETISR